MRRARLNLYPLILGLWWCCLTWWLPAATTNTVSTAEEISFNAAAQAFRDGLYDRAAKGFAEFAAQFPNSERLPDVILREAQARYKLGQHDQVTRMLQAGIGRAGKIADKYRFWIGESCFQRGEYAAAAGMYAQLLKDYPESFLKSNASYSEALSWFRMGNLTNAVARLRQPDGPFQKAAQTQTNDEFVVRGHLLLAEALLLQREYRQAEETLKSLTGRTMPPQLVWQQQYLLARVLLADNRAAAASQGLTNLLSAATATGDPDNRADTVLLQGEILQADNQLPAAIQVYAQQQAALPPAQQRLALRRLIEWHLQSGGASQAITNLEIFVSRFPQDPIMDQIRLTLGELRLNQYRTFSPEGQTNAAAAAAARAVTLQQARTNLDLLMAGFPKSPLAGRAQLQRGWCFWEAGQMPESRDAFKDAAERLPVSTNQALARFKYADSLFQLKEYAGAATNYWLVLERYAALTNLPSFLTEQSLHQIIRANAALGNAVDATRALDRMLTQYPQSPLTDNCLLLTGQLLDQLDRAPEARARFEDLLKRYPNSELAPEARLALARSFVREPNWPSAIREYDAWTVRHTNHARLAQVEYDRAWAYDQAGRETNAFALFTNYVARFPNDPRAPLAQYWTGDFFFNRGKFDEAERNYQLVYQNTNWNSIDLFYQARLAAGRAAFKRQGYKDAADSFIALIKLLQADTNSQPALLYEAYLALGDTLRTQPVPETDTNRLNKFAEAINAFKKIPETNELAPQALGLIADCHFQLAAQAPARYADATNAYVKVITNAPLAGVEARCNAEAGLAKVYEKLAAAKPPAEQDPLIQAALDCYLNILYRKNLKPGEKPSPFWMAHAGQEAARLLEARGKWGEAAKIYQTLLEILPSSLKGTLEKKLDYARKRG